MTIEDKNKNIWGHILLLYGVVFSLWTVYRIFFSLPEWVDEFIAKPILWLGPLLFFRKFTEIHIDRNNLFKNILFGGGIGLLYFTGFTALTRFSPPYPIVNPDHLSALGILLQGAISISTGFIEEVLFRAIILEKINSIVNDSALSNGITSLLFAAIHLPIILFVYKYPPAAAISYLAILTISGFIYGLVYLKNKSLAASTVTHAVWNFLGTVIR